VCKGKEVCPLWTDPATGNRIAATGCSWDQLLPTSFEATHEKRLTCECSGAKGDRCILHPVAALRSTSFVCGTAAAAACVTSASYLQHHHGAAMWQNSCRLTSSEVKDERLLHAIL
jgi:hypothetical protein